MNDSVTPSRKSKPSQAFARIKREVLELTLQIPRGRVASYAEMGALLEVMPRHVAYILATLTAAEAELFPWYRTVSASGKLLNPANRERATLQGELLRLEGVAVDARGVVKEIGRFQHHFI